MRGVDRLDRVVVSVALAGEHGNSPSMSLALPLVQGFRLHRELGKALKQAQDSGLITADGVLTAFAADTEHPAAD